MTEEIKAVTEVAKTTGKAIDASREVGGFISKFIAGPLEQGIGIFEDKLKYQRWEQQVALMEKANRKMKERGLQAPTQAIPMKIAIPLFQASCLENDDDLQELWANLLVNGADKDSGIRMRRFYISLLQDLNAFDALVFNKLYSVKCGFHQPIWTHGLPESIFLEEPPRGEDNKIPNEKVELSLEILCKLGLIEPVAYMNGNIPIKSVTHTLLGHKFHEACTERSD